MRKVSRFVAAAHPLSSKGCRFGGLLSLSVLCKEAWHQDAHCSWALDVRQPCASYTTSVQFYRLASLSQWTSVSGICTNSRCAWQKLLLGSVAKWQVLRTDTVWNQYTQPCIETLPVQLGLGPLWNVALWKFWLVIRQQTLSMEKTKAMFMF